MILNISEIIDNDNNIVDYNIEYHNKVLLGPKCISLSWLRQVVERDPGRFDNYYDKLLKEFELKMYLKSI